MSQPVKVEVLGPRSHTETFHVHRVGCADLRRRENRPYARGWVATVSTARQLAEEIYSDFIFSNDEDPWTEYVIGSRVVDTRVFPCVGDLPRDGDEHEIGTFELDFACDPFQLLLALERMPRTCAITRVVAAGPGGRNPCVTVLGPRGEISAWYGDDVATFEMKVTS